MSFSRSCRSLRVWILLLSPGCVFAADYEVTFGKLGLAEGAYVIVDETSVVPDCEEGEQAYGFSVRRTPPGEFRARAEYVLPAAPEVLSSNLSDESTTDYAKGIPGDERVLETQGMWRIRFDEGDPLGSYAVRVFVADVLRHVVEFELVACR